jgi:tRNA pseudouridine55 synthase
MKKLPLKNIDGIFLLNKPLDMSSNFALQRVKRLFGAKKAGHTGSLDPLATGMLPICFGEATKFSQFLLESDKCYQVTAKLGEKTATGDAEGEVILTRPVPSLSRDQLEKILSSFLGAQQQIPPMYSAIKFQGKPLYELARQGIEIDRQPRTIHIYQLDLMDFTQDSLSLMVHCSKGTYVRTLVEDIGEVLGCGAHVSMLHRSVVFPYKQDNMVALSVLEETLKQQGVDALKQFLLPVETSVESFPAIKLSTSAIFYIKTGQPVMVPHLPTEGLVRLFSNESRFLGVGEILEDGRVAPRRLISQSSQQAVKSVIQKNI